MSYAFKKGQVVVTKERQDMRGSGGPNIPRGTKATVLKRFRDSVLIFVDYGLQNGIGRRFALTTDFVAK